MSEAQMEAQSSGGELDGLLREMGRQASRPQDPDVRRILEWLHARTGAQVALVAVAAADGVGRVETATPGFPRRLPDSLSGLLVRLSTGQLAAAATRDGELHVRAAALGPHEPRPVLVAAFPGEPAPEQAALLSHTAAVLTLLRRAGDSDRSWRNYQRSARQMRIAVLQALLAGDVLLARRMTTGVVPPLLEAPRVRLHLLHCPVDDRDRIVRAEQDASGYHGPDLLVQCPVFKDHLICLVAEDEHEDGGKGAYGRGAMLRRLVRDNSGYALGVSGSHPLAATAAAYSQATHALAAARAAPDRIAYYHGRSPLEGVLPRQPALDWARTLLAPLQEAPETSADVTRLAMTMPRTAVARLLDLSRNTVTAHLRRAERALGRDLTEVRARADVHLALSLDSSGAARPVEVRSRPVTLDHLLRTERAAAWSETLLHPLQDRHVRTLQVWIEANTDAQRAAQRMGISRNTVRAHLRAAENVLGLDLLTLGTGTHDIVHALRIARVRTG
ncbi:helix-turn-helix domain-containing protein [Streptomyces albiaxialis]|uniref:helix-turn-helix domain-containing protein n=1 Tax=Streptomyces albiaxialis TaxID=329523 RepID=UPI0031D0A085